MEWGVLGCVAVAHDDPPGATADPQLIAFHQAPIVCTKRGHAPAVVAAALLNQLESVAGKAVALEHGDDALEGEPRASVAHRVRGEILGLGHPHLRSGALDEPRGETGVVGMMVGDDEARDRAPGDALGEDALPQPSRDIVAYAAVDERPGGLPG